MTKPLIVILGAGASHDCTDRNPGDDQMPPLAKDLFAEVRRPVWSHYPLLKGVATDIPAETAGQLETFLREERFHSPHRHLRAQYWSVPLYLQDLFQRLSIARGGDADNYERLLDQLLRLDKATFVTLNYDTIFERACEKYQSFASLEDYVSGPQVSLVKLHGSVNWGVEIAGAEPSPGRDQYIALCHGLARDDFQVGTAIEQLIPPSRDGTANDIRTSSYGFRYPALSVPLGPEDELVCPDNQKAHIRSRLDQQQVGYGLNVLIVGYSCLDKQPLELIKKSGNRIESLVVVNGNKKYGENAYAELLQHLAHAAPQRRIETDIVEIFDGGFTEFTKSDRLPALVDRLTT